MIMTISIQISTGWRTFMRAYVPPDVVHADTVRLHPFPDGAAPFPLGDVERVRKVVGKPYDLTKSEANGLEIELEPFRKDDLGFRQDFYEPKEVHAIAAYLLGTGWKETLWPPKED